MKVKLTLEIDIDETNYPSLLESDIKNVMKRITMDDFDDEEKESIIGHVEQALGKRNRIRLFVNGTTDLHKLDVIGFHCYVYTKLDFYFQLNGENVRAVVYKYVDKVELEHVGTATKSYKINKYFKDLIFRSDVFHDWLSNKW